MNFNGGRQFGQRALTILRRIGLLIWCNQLCRIEHADLARSRTGFARCGGAVLGVLVHKFDVILDADQQSASESQTPQRGTPTEFSIKKPSQWLWRTNVSREQILQRLNDFEIDEEWLVCPLGEADRAITVGEFVSESDEQVGVFNKPTTEKQPD